MYLVKEKNGVAVYFNCNTQTYTVFKDGKILVGGKFKYSDVRAYVE